MTKIFQKTLVVIPVRLAATRLPNKPLADICGKSMIRHVWEKAVEADVGPVVVACGDSEIVQEVKSFGGEAVFTDPALPTGTDRVKAAADIYDPQNTYEYVINVQGDLPTLDPSLIREALDPFQDPLVDIATLATSIEDPHELTDGNVVKIALSVDGDETIGRALYFSRTLIPSGTGPHYHHIGLYAFQREALNRYVSLPVNALEVRERLEQLRALAHGMRIDVKVVNTKAPFGVDTAADLEKAIRIIGESYSL
jgi:3-deoxy-manno-octulosonate cytidylyltransferase (CMP-KDO synthetase)